MVPARHFARLPRGSRVAATERERAHWSATIHTEKISRPENTRPNLREDLIASLIAEGGWQPYWAWAKAGTCGRTNVLQAVLNGRLGKWLWVTAEQRRRTVEAGRVLELAGVCELVGPQSAPIIRWLPPALAPTVLDPVDEQALLALTLSDTDTQGLGSLGSPSRVGRSTTNP